MMQKYSLNGPMQKILEDLGDLDGIPHFLEDYLPGVEVEVTVSGILVGHNEHWYIIRSHKNGTWVGAYGGEEKPVDKRQEYLVTFTPRFHADGRGEALVALIALIYADNDDVEFRNLMGMMALDLP